MMRRITVLSEHTVTVLTEGREERKLSAPAGALFLQLLKGNGYSLVCCNGKGGCGRCRIRFLDGDAPLPMPADRNAFTAQELRDGVRLACVHRVKKDCRIRVEFVHPKQVEVVAGYTGTDRVEAGSRRKGGVQEAYLLAMDLGTTTIAANAVTLRSLQDFGGFSGKTADGEKVGAGLHILAQAGRMNPQREWGSDVVSRIQAAGQGEADALRDAAGSAVRALITDITKKSVWRETR